MRLLRAPLMGRSEHRAGATPAAALLMAVALAAPVGAVLGQSAPSAVAAVSEESPSSVAAVPSGTDSASDARAGVVLSAPPEHPDPAGRYVIYLHGAILESQGRDAVHPRFGRYHYGAILDSLASRGVNVLSEVREEDTDGAVYASTVAEWVDGLTTAGVPPENITVLGFSKGGGIAMRACTLISNESVNYVFMACCPRNMPSWPNRDYRGRILAIHESSDRLAGSCRGAVLGGAGAGGVPGVVYEEIEIETGLEHGAFYGPLEEWLEPAILWALGGGPSDG